MAKAYLQACALLRFYFGMDYEKIYLLTPGEFAMHYEQLMYAMEFDAARASSDGKKQIYPPL